MYNECKYKHVCVMFHFVCGICYQTMHPRLFINHLTMYLSENITQALVNIPAVSERSLRRDFASSAITMTAEIQVTAYFTVLLNSVVHLGGYFG